MNTDKSENGKAETQADWADKITRSLIHESDRGCILIGVALLDEALVENLRLAFRKDPAVQKKFIDPLFESNGPLNSFSNRISLAYALGLISADVRDDLNTLRRLRNEVAHLYGPTSFQEHGIRSRVSSLRMVPVLTGPAPMIKNKSGFVHQQSEEDRRSVLIERIAFFGALSGLYGAVKAGGDIFEHTLSAARTKTEAIIDHALRKKKKKDAP